MPDNQIEKSLLYLVLVSTLLHAAAFGLISLLPPEPPPREKVTMVELSDLPTPPAPEKPKPEPKPSRPVPPPLPRFVPPAQTPRLPPERTLPQARKETAPKANNDTERMVTTKSAPNLPGQPEPQPARSPGETDSAVVTPEKGGREAMRGEGIFRPQQGAKNNLAKLFPSARNLERLEDGFRKKYLQAEKGDTRLMDTDDPDIGVFNRRYRKALVERLNSIEHSTKVGLGRTVLNIAIKRDGSVDEVTVLYSSGNKALDALAVQASRTAGYVGPLPRRWPYDRLNMICGFIVEQGFVTTGWYAE